jgi:hypothetical protein
MMVEKRIVSAYMYGFERIFCELPLRIVPSVENLPVICGGGNTRRGIVLNMVDNMYVLEIKREIDSVESCLHINAASNENVRVASTRSSVFTGADMHGSFMELTVTLSCGCEERCHVKFEKIYAMVNFASENFIISIDVLPAKMIMEDGYRCAAMWLTDMLRKIGNEWLCQRKIRNFTEYLQRAYIDGGPLRLCAGSILKSLNMRQFKDAVRRYMEGTTQ